MFTDTSLKLFHWLKVQEIWAQLYIIKNLRKREQVCDFNETNYFDMVVDRTILESSVNLKDLRTSYY